MRSLAWLAFAALLAPAPHIRIAATPPATAAKPGETLSLFVDILPDRGIHVYAPGATDYQPIAIKLKPADGVAPGKLSYPKSEMLSIPETGEHVPVYTKPFRLTQAITIAKTAHAGTRLVVTGTVAYQACDDQVCFLPAELPVSWMVDVK